MNCDRGFGAIKLLARVLFGIFSIVSRQGQMCETGCCEKVNSKQYFSFQIGGNKSKLSPPALLRGGTEAHHTLTQTFNSHRNKFDIAKCKCQIVRQLTNHKIRPVTPFSLREGQYPINLMELLAYFIRNLNEQFR